MIEPKFRLYGLTPVNTLILLQYLRYIIEFDSKNSKKIIL